MTDSRDQTDVILETLREQCELCFDHSGSLLDASTRLLDGEPAHYNLSYHFSLLALEEIGKVNMLVSRAALRKHRDGAWFEKRLGSHTEKLFWAVWSPIDADNKIEPKKFEELKQFCESAHQRRLDGLYVNPDAETVAPPNSHISEQQARSMNELASQFLQMAIATGIPDLESQDEIQLWFLEQLSDEDARSMLFNARSLRKLEELEGSVRDWAIWLRTWFEEREKVQNRLARLALTKTTSDGTDAKPRWRLRVRVYCASHSLRAKILNIWNDGIDTAKLIYAKKNELILELTYPNTITADRAHDSAISLSKLIVAALNMGTAGFFWFELPTQDSQYFEKIEDLENKSLRLSIARGTGFSGHWLSDGKEKSRSSLNESNIFNAVKCAIAFGGMEDKHAEPIFGPYLHGLSTLAKSNLHLSLDEIAFSAFSAALRAGLKHFENWNGEEETLLQILHSVLSEVIPEKSNREIVLAHISAPPERHGFTQEHAVDAKRLADLYFAIVGDRHYQQIIKNAR